MVLLFKGIAPPSQFRATIASGALLRGPQQRGQDQSGPKRGRKCYITPTFSGVPNIGDVMKVGPKEGGDATSPLHFRGSPHEWGQNQNWLPKLCLVEDPQVTANPTSTLLSQGYPSKGRKTKHQENKKNKSKKFPMASLTLRVVRSLAPLGLEPRTIQLQGHCSTPRVWHNSDKPLQRGGIHI